MTCQDAIALVCDYLEGLLGADALAALERHLSDCQPCLAYLDTYRRARELGIEVSRVEMPAEMKARLRRFLEEELRERSG